MIRLVHLLRIRLDLLRLMAMGHVRRRDGSWHLTDRGRLYVEERIL
jgi:hypothetical protein